MKKSHYDLNDVSKMIRNDVVPYYADLIHSYNNAQEAIRVNNLILSKWSPSGLIYIKNKAWKSIESSQNKR